MNDGMSQTRVWGDGPLTWQMLVQVARHNATLTLSDSAWQRIAQSRDIVGNIVAAGQVAYGINTGLGALCNITLSEDELS
jgi:histidine ammonia-lyase